MGVILARWLRHWRMRRAAALHARAEALRHALEHHAVDHIRDGLRAEIDRLQRRIDALWALIADDWRAP